MADIRPKRKAPPRRVKLAVLERQGDRCAHCRAELFTSPATAPVFDHSPPLALRPVNDAGDDFVPPQHSIAHLHAICADPCNKLKTFGHSRATTRGGDVTEIARTKRISAAHARHLARIAGAEPAAVARPSRPMPSRPMQSKNNFRGSSGFPTGRKFPTRAR